MPVALGEMTADVSLVARIPERQPRQQAVAAAVFGDVPGRRLVGIEQREAADAAVQLADTLYLTVPNQLGVDYNARLLKTIADHIAPAIGWSRKAE